MRATRGRAARAVAAARCASPSSTPHPASPSAMEAPPSRKAALRVSRGAPLSTREPPPSAAQLAEERAATEARRPDGPRVASRAPRTTQPRARSPDTRPPQPRGGHRSGCTAPNSSPYILQYSIQGLLGTAQRIKSTRARPRSVLYIPARPLGDLGDNPVGNPGGKPGETRYPPAIPCPPTPEDGPFTPGRSLPNARIY